MAKRKKGFRTFLSIFALVLLGVGSWVLYELITESIFYFFAIFGITNKYFILSSILVLIIILLSFSGYGLWRTIRKIAD